MFHFVFVVFFYSEIYSIFYESIRFGIVPWVGMVSMVFRRHETKLRRTSEREVNEVWRILQYSFFIDFIQTTANRLCRLAYHLLQKRRTLMAVKKGIRPLSFYWKVRGDYFIVESSSSIPTSTNFDFWTVCCWILFLNQIVWLLVVGDRRNLDNQRLILEEQLKRTVLGPIKYHQIFDGASVLITPVLLRF